MGNAGQAALSTVEPRLGAAREPGSMNRIVVGAEAMLAFRGGVHRCALGRNGVTAEKREGDAATPAGVHPLREVFYRRDRIPRPVTGLPVRPIRACDGWCDDPEDPAYNRLVPLPYPASAERLWRDDRIYDAVVVVGYNDRPPTPGRGSAIFLHVARDSFAPTAGCVALAMDDLLAVLKGCDRDTKIDIRGPTYP